MAVALNSDAATLRKETKCPTVFMVLGLGKDGQHAWVRAARRGSARRTPARRRGAANPRQTLGQLEADVRREAGRSEAENCEEDGVGQHGVDNLVTPESLADRGLVFLIHRRAEEAHDGSDGVV